jgi:hypothetical protein
MAQHGIKLLDMSRQAERLGAPLMADTFKAMYVDEWRENYEKLMAQANGGVK